MNQPTLVTVAQSTVSPSFCLNAMSTPAEQENPRWYPMRVTYSREMLVKDFAHPEGIADVVHATQTGITEMKMTRSELAPLRYMMRPVLGIDGKTARREILVVPDKQMEDFIRVASVEDDRVFYMDNLDFVGKPGQRVRIVEGEFAGVEGIVKRVKKNKCVVVQIEHVAAVAIAFLPSAFIMPIED